MNTLSRGAWSGLIATSQMTQFLFLGFDRLEPREKSPLPPATLTYESGRRAGLSLADKGERENSTLVSHYLFGIGCAALYSALQAGRKRQTHPALEGAGFGLAVWLSCYFAGIPALGFRASAYRMPASRNALMGLAHLVWGASLGLAESGLRRQGSQMLDGSKKRIAAE